MSNAIKFPKVEWSKEDWIDFYRTLEAFAARVTARSEGQVVQSTVKASSGQRHFHTCKDHATGTDAAIASLQEQIRQVEADPEVMPACMLSLEEAKALVPDTNAALIRKLETVRSVCEGEEWPSMDETCMGQIAYRKLNEVIDALRVSPPSAERRMSAEGPFKLPVTCQAAGDDWVINDRERQIAIVASERHARWICASLNEYTDLLGIASSTTRTFDEDAVRKIFRRAYVEVDDGYHLKHHSSEDVCVAVVRELFGIQSATKRGSDG